MGESWDAPSDRVTIEDLLQIETDTGTEWPTDMKAIERVISVALGVDTPRTATWIADEAEVSETTARDHLRLLVDRLGVLMTTTTPAGRKYWPDEAYIRFRHVSQLVEKHDKDELTAHVATLKERIEAFQDEYDTEGPDELRTKAADDGVTADEAREYRQAASEWETVEFQLSTTQDALRRYDDYAQGYQRDLKLGASGI